MPKRDVTAGETLCTFIKRNILDSSVWIGVSDKLAATGRGEQWGEFFEEIVATQLTGRLVTAGRSMAEALGGKSSIGNLQFSQQVRSLAIETMLTSLNTNVRVKFYDLVQRAVRATYGDPTDADKEIIREEAGRRAKCYLCNRLLEMRLDAIPRPTEDQAGRAVEFEHVWPRALGGDTVIDNLALSCHTCNKRKDSYANWAMVDIQSMFLGHNPTERSLAKIPGWRRFAMLSYAAHKLAHEESLSLKSAHLRLQRHVTVPRVRRIADAADFFNLIGHIENHS